MNFGYDSLNGDKRKEFLIMIMYKIRCQSLQNERCEKLILGKANRQINRCRHKN